EDGIEFMYGPPEPANLRALLRAGARAVGEVRRFARPRALQRALAWVARHAPRSGLRLEALVGADARVAAVWERVAAGARISPIPDPEQYAWRFGAPSGRQRAFGLMEAGRPLALCALERRGAAVAIVDLFAPPHRYVDAARAVADAAGDANVSIQLNASA